MKHLLCIFAFILLLAGCSRPKDELTSAAMDIYKQYYRHSKTLDVAFVGGYQNVGQTYNAVMFHTADSTEWEWLKKEFGIFSTEEIQKGSSGEGVISTGGGTFAGTPQTPQGSIMATLMVDTTREFKDTAEFMAYVDSMVYEVLREAYGDSVAKARKRPVMVMDLDSMPEEMPYEKVYSHQKMADFTAKHGSVAYFVNVDYARQTIWLFFKDTSATDMRN